MRYGTKYLHLLFRLRCAPDLLGLGIYPNLKEWTEACSMHRAAWSLTQEEDVTALVIGDGRAPRVGAMLAFRTPWNVVSCDPCMNGRWESAGIRRLACLVKRGEEIVHGDVPESETLLIMLPHSHFDAPLPSVTDKFKRVALISMPCCVPTSRVVKESEPAFTYIDRHVHSPKNVIEIYHIKGKWPDRVEIRK